MATSEIEQWWIDKFQENLGPIRKVAGWTTQQLADELGVARQTVSNLETGKSPMTKLQYLALRTVFSAEIARRETAIWHASQDFGLTIPLSNASRTARSRAGRRGRFRQCPSQYGRWQRCRQRRHRETQAQCQPH